MLHHLDGWIANAGPWALWFLGAAALIEYLFPPFPGDTIALLGGVYAARGEKSWVPVLVVVTLGSIIGAAINFMVGRLLAGQLETRPRLLRFFGLNPTRLQRLQERMRRQGPWLIIINRFLPGIRSLTFVVAGAARMETWVVLWSGVLSALVYNTLLVATGRVVGGNAERLELLIRRWQVGVTVVLCAGAALLLVRWVVRRRRPVEATTE